MKHKLKIVGMGIALLLVSMASCALSGGPIDGQVLDETTGKPIADAIVSVTWVGDWYAVVETKTSCYHAETAQTDSNGKYHITGWSLPWKMEHMMVSDKAVYFSAHKKGYTWSERLPPKKEIVLLVPFKGTEDEYIDRLERVASSQFCTGARESRKNLYPLYAELIEEVKALAETPKQEMLMDRLNYIVNSI